MRALIDTSAFVKILMEEAGSERADAIWDDADVLLASRLLYPEARSALARARRAGRLSSRLFTVARDRLEARWRELRIVELGPEVARLAGDLTDSFRLAAGDAVHLASAVVVGDLTVVTWDRRLAAAAHDAGLAVAPAFDR